MYTFKSHPLLLLAFAALLLSLAACKGEKKLTTYATLYKEKPTSIFVAPVDDKAKRRAEKSQLDKDYNHDMDLATRYLQQVLATPLVDQGYYVPGALASKLLDEQLGLSAKQLNSGDIKPFARTFGVDAVLCATIHRWGEKNGLYSVFIEFVLRSTKSNSDLMHTWVKASKRITANYKNEPVALKIDNDLAAAMNLSDVAAQRCQLLQLVSYYVLNDLPCSPDREFFEKGQKVIANPSYFNFFFNENGEMTIETSEMESFEEDCFVD